MGDLVYNHEGDGAVSLENFRKDITIELLNLQGTVVKAYNVFRCWVSEFTALPTRRECQRARFRDDHAATRRLRARRSCRRTAGILIMLELRLFPGLPGGRWAFRPHHRRRGTECRARRPGRIAVLFDHLLLECDGTTVGPGRALDLAVPDNDRIAAEIYCQEYGDRCKSNHSLPAVR